MFDIEPVTLIVSTLFMCAFCAPFIYYSQKNNKKNKVLISRLHELASLSGAKLTEIETWRSRYGLGLDSNKKILIYCQNAETQVSKILYLNEYRKVSLIKNTKEQKSSNQNYSIPQSVTIELVPRMENSEKLHLEIYHADHFTDLQGETVLAEKWYNTLKNEVHS